MLMQPLRLIELFSGYGSQALALKYLGIPIEHHFVCEWDKYAMQSYNDIHGTDFTTTDIRNVTAKDLNITDTDTYKYLMTYSFPCTDLSVAGRQRGMQRDSGTSSSLLWEVERLLSECTELPQYLLMENVPQVISKDNIELFAEWTEFLTGLGYKNYYKVLNAKDFEIPQNRERCFMVSILRSENKTFVFPSPKPLDKRLKDVLEPPEDVDEKYYIRNEKAQKLLQQLYERGQLKPMTVNLMNMGNGGDNPDVKETSAASTICVSDRCVNNYGCNAVIEKGYLEKGTGQHQSNTVYDVQGISPTLPSQYLTNVIGESKDV